MAKSSKSAGEWVAMFMMLFLTVSIAVYSLSGIFTERNEPVDELRVFALESSLAATSGFLAPANSWFRNKNDGNFDETGFWSDMSRYGEVYDEGLRQYPVALIIGDLFGSIFSVLSAIMFFFAIRSPESWAAFKILFFTEIVEETLYYINVYLMTNVFDVGPIDVGVTLAIALIVASFGEYARSKRAK